MRRIAATVIVATAAALSLTFAFFYFSVDNQQLLRGKAFDVGISDGHLKKWKSYARKHRCHGYDYGQIEEDLRPFRFWKKWAVEHSLTVSSLEASRAALNAFHFVGSTKAPATFTFRNRTVKLAKFSYSSSWAVKPTLEALLSRDFVQDLPEMTITVNLLDEPRLGRHPCFANAMEANDTSLLEACDNLPICNGFSVSCLRNVCNDTVERFGDSHGFLIEPPSFFVATPKIPFPIFSLSKIPECFYDIMFPTHYDYRPNPLPLPEQQPSRGNKIYWRGSTTGMQVTDLQKAQASHRFRLVKFAHGTELPQLDAEFVGLGQCVDPKCEEIRLAPREEPESLTSHKYIVAIDGNTRTIGERIAFQSASVVFRISIFSSWYSLWLRPWRDFIPVQPDLKDFSAAYELAESQYEIFADYAKSRSRATQHSFEKGADCYLYRLLLEYYEIFGQ